MKLLRTPLSALAYMALAALQVRGQYPPPPSQRPVVPSGGIHFSENGQFNGSVASGTASATPLKLTLQDAIDRGLKTNLGLLVRGSDASAARAERLRTLSALLPNVSAAFAENETQISLAVYGFHFAGVPSIVGPFSFTDARAFANVPAFDWTAFKNLKAAAENARAAQLSHRGRPRPGGSGGGLRISHHPGRLRPHRSNHGCRSPPRNALTDSGPRPASGRRRCRPSTRCARRWN